MGELKIRKIDDAVIKKLNILSKQNGISREEYLRQYINNLAVLGELKEIEEKYTSLIKTLGEVIERNTQALEQVNFKLSE